MTVPSDRVRRCYAPGEHVALTTPDGRWATGTIHRVFDNEVGV